MFCYQLVAVYFVVNLLQQVVVLPMVSFFVVFALTIHMTKFDLTESSDQILFISMLQIWNFRFQALLNFQMCRS